MSSVAGCSSLPHYIFGRFLPFLRGHWRPIWFVGFLALATRAAALPAPLICRRIVDEILASHRDERLLGSVLGLACTLVASTVLGYTLQLVAIQLRQAVLHDVRLAILKHLSRMDLDFFRRQKSGGLLSRIMSDVSTVQSVLSEEVFHVAAAAIQVVVVGLLLFWLEPRLALVVALAVPMQVVLVKFFQRPLYRMSRRMQEQREALSAQVQENLGAMRLLQATTSESRELVRAGKASELLRDSLVKAERVGVGANSLSILLTEVPLALLVWGYGGKLVLSGSLTLGGLIAFHQYLLMLHQPVVRVFRFRIELESARAAVDRVWEVLDAKAAVREHPAAVPLVVQGGHVRFEHVTLAYSQEGEAAVRDVSFELKPGEVIGLVGPSGAGKSTIVNGLLRFLEPRAGRITIDGQDIRKVTLESLRKQIGLVDQDVLLLGDTIASNLTLACPKASPEQVERAARLTQAHEFILQLPKAYATVLGERGGGLSGGQRQRLALARVLVQDPPIMVLDEATAAVDARSEELIHDALAYAIRGRSAIIIAHRFSTLKLCHRIAVMQDGRIEEVGTRTELMRRRGLFTRLLAAQTPEWAVSADAAEGTTFAVPLSSSSNLGSQA